MFSVYLLVNPPYCLLLLFELFLLDSKLLPIRACVLSLSTLTSLAYKGLNVLTKSWSSQQGQYDFDTWNYCYCLIYIIIGFVGSIGSFIWVGFLMSQYGFCWWKAIYIHFDPSTLPRQLYFGNIPAHVAQFWSYPWEDAKSAPFWRNHDPSYPTNPLDYLPHF